jgi:hypothetical protein
MYIHREREIESFFATVFFVSAVKSQLFKYMSLDYVKCVKCKLKDTHRRHVCNFQIPNDTIYTQYGLSQRQILHVQL